MASQATYNERLKLISGTLQNLAIALTVVIVGVSWTDGISLDVVIGTAVAIFLYALAYAILGNLEEYES
jgi:hypothetical protein